MPTAILDQPRGRGLLLTSAHPVGCATQAQRQIDHAKQHYRQPLEKAQGKTALVLGGTSFGYGSGAVMALKAAGFKTVYNVGFENTPALKGKNVRSASGPYITKVMHDNYTAQGIQTYFADAFQDATRERLVKDIHDQGDGIDLVLYSIAAARRVYNGNKWESSLGVIGDALEISDIDYSEGKPVNRIIQPGTPQEIENTVKVMGGEDLKLWVDALQSASLLRNGIMIGALSYIGPDFNPIRRVYWDGVIGQAKKHIDLTTAQLREQLASINGTAFSIVDPAVVTTASAALPGIVKYLSAYLGAASVHFGEYLTPLEVSFLMVDALYGNGNRELDSEGRLRLDHAELKKVIQAKIQEIWNQEGDEGQLPDLIARGFTLYQRAYYQLFGFGVPGVDYSQEVEIDPGLTAEMGVHNLLAATV